MKTFGEYVKACREMTREAFCENYPHPFFLYSTLAAGGMTPVKKTRVPTVDRLVVGDTPGGEVKSRSPEDWFIVYEVVQHERPAREGMSLGCSTKCDVRLDDASVSRFHARMWQARHAFYLEDADSSAGTAVNGDTLESGQPQQVRSGDRVSLGNVDLVFLMPEDFYKFVKRLAGGG